MPAAAITAIVVSYDSAEVLPACLDALAGEGVPAIVVDNASGDDSRAMTAEERQTTLTNMITLALDMAKEL